MTKNMASEHFKASIVNSKRFVEFVTDLWLPAHRRISGRQRDPMLDNLFSDFFLITKKWKNVEFLTGTKVYYTNTLAH